MICTLPLGTTQEIVDRNIQTMERMLEHNERVQEEEKKRWDSLTPEQKQSEKEAPLLAYGIKKCPQCGCLALPWWSLAEGWGFEIWSYNFGPKRYDEKLLPAQAYPSCGNHLGESRQKIHEMRFHSQDELVAFWNNLLTAPNE